MAVSIDTRTAFVRFIGWVWEDTHKQVWVPPGFWRPLPEPVVQVFAGAGVGTGCPGIPEG